MRRSPLAAVLDQALRCALFSGAAACGGQSDDVGKPFSFPGTDPAAPPSTGVEPGASVGADLTQQACSVEAAPLAHLSLAAGYDFVALRRSNESELLEDGRSELDSLGVACARAVDVGLCREALAQAWPSPAGDWVSCGQVGCSVQALVTTRADEVQVHESVAAIGELLGPIDGAPEATLWARANGYAPSCQPVPYFELPALKLFEMGQGYRLDLYEMISDCPMEYQHVIVDLARDGRVNEVVRVDAAGPPNVTVCAGRRPPGWVRTRHTCLERNAAARPALRWPGADAAARELAAIQVSSDVGAFFAEMAALEGAAIRAFELLEAELVAHGAPLELQRAAQAAQADERRHVQACSRLARRYGVSFAPEALGAGPSRGAVPRGLFELALENMVEGCVRETFGAAVARYQACSSADEVVRASLASIAADEARHAELAWAIHDWLGSRLSPEQHVALGAAGESAIAELMRELQTEVSAALRHAAGLPDATRARSLLDVLHAELWTTVDQAA
jgi:hypothetical protein